MKKDPWIIRVVVLGCLLAGVAAQLSFFNSPTVETSDGKLRGKYVLTRGGRKVRAFLGIPYAKPPLENLRFRSPEPVEPWEQERLALDHPKPCVQPERRHGEPTGREDCLYLNIYTPDIPPSHQEKDTHTSPKQLKTEPVHNKTNDDIISNEIPLNGTGSIVTQLNETAAASNETTSNTTINLSECPLLPVMVFFHGGAFEMGNSEPFTHEYFLDHDIVVVTVQYRLGLLGFFSTGDEVLPGNLGFKDQRFALNWIQKNIPYFGGCPHRVTIFGDGVGGASVHYHMLFNNPKNATFRAGISMSGTALSPWAFRPPTEVLHIADRVAALSGCPRESLALVHCLRWKPAEELVKILQEYKNESRDGCGDWVHALPMLGGVLENATSVPDAFVITSPWDKKVSMPWIVGVTSKELLYEFTPHLVDRKDKLFKQLDKCFNETLPKVLGYQFSNASGAELASAARGFYFDNQPLSRDNFAAIIDVVSDGSVVYPAFEAVRRAGRKTTWLYHFDFLGANTFGPSALDGRIAPGRGDDLFYFFPRPLGKNVPRKTKEVDTTMSRKMMKLWTNFAIQMDPTPEEVDGLKWAPTTPSTTFLNISQTNMTVDRPFLANRMNFWSLQDYPYRDDDYKHEYALPPTPTKTVGGMPMSMENSQMTAEKMATIIHDLRKTKLEEMLEPKVNETEIHFNPGVLLEANDLSVESVAELLQNFRVSQISDVSELNMLRYAVSGVQISAPKVEQELASQKVVGMADFFHTLRMSQPAVDPETEKNSLPDEEPTKRPVNDKRRNRQSVVQTPPKHFAPSEG